MKQTIHQLLLFILLSLVAECTESKQFNTMTVVPKPPEILYYVVPDKYIKKTLTVGIKSREDSYMALFSNTKSIIDLLEKEPDKFRGISLILQIDTKKMIRDGYKIIRDKKGKWLTKEIPSQYISVLK